MTIPTIISAQFTVGAVHLDQIPADGIPHIAFFGRSNVGKSSLLNALMGVKGLVKVSSKPGKTREINFFKVNDAFYFADLPGIGYAKVSLSQREKMARIIKDYVEKSADLRGIVYLVDMRHAGTPLDIETVNILRDLGKPVLIVASKRDKLSQAEAAQSSKEIQKRFELEHPPLAVSVLKKIGLGPLWQTILAAVAEPEIGHGH